MSAPPASDDAARREEELWAEFAILMTLLGPNLVTQIIYESFTLEQLAGIVERARRLVSANTVANPTPN